jgi:hypothetical protein
MTFPGPIAIDRMFPDSALLEVRSQDFDEEGTEVATYSTLASGVPAQIYTSSAVSDVRTGDGSFEVRERNIILSGWYPDLDETSRVTISGHTYYLKGSAIDSWDDKSLGGWTVLVGEERIEAEGVGS